jgi:hypothetical protein
MARLSAAQAPALGAQDADRSSPSEFPTRDAIEARRLLSTLESILAAGDTEQLQIWLFFVIGHDPNAPDQPRFSTDVLKRLAELYGGELALVDDLAHALLSRPGQLLVLQLSQRLRGRAVSPETIEKLAALFPEPLRDASVIKQFGVFLVDEYPAIINEILANATEFYARQADELADEGHPNLAALLKTASDLLLPGDVVDAGLMLLPIGKLAGVIRLVAQRVATRAAATQLGKAGLEAANKAAELAAKHLKDRFARISTMNVEVIDQLAKHLARHSDDFAKVLEIFNTKIEKTVPKGVLEFFLVRDARKKVKAIADDVLEGLFVAKDPAKVKHILYEVFDDGRVVQEIRTTIKKRAAGRVSNASKTAEREAKVHASLKSERRDWGHIIPDVLDGEDAAYNLVLFSRRINRSIYKKVDRLIEENAALNGKEVLVYAEYASVEAAQKRIAESIMWYVPEAGGKDAVWMVIGNPLNRPSVTLADALRGIEAFFRALRRQSED